MNRHAARVHPFAEQYAWHVFSDFGLGPLASPLWFALVVLGPALAAPGLDLFPEAAVPVKVVGAIRGSRLAEKNVVRDTSEPVIRLVDERKRETIGLPALPGWDRQLTRTEGGNRARGKK